jgi:putative transposase
MLAGPGDWPWSSYRAHVGEAATPPWLDADGLHGYLLQRPAATAADHRRAAQRYAELVAAGHGEALWDEGLRQQIYLGDETFVDRMQVLADAPRKA